MATAGTSRGHARRRQVASSVPCAIREFASRGEARQFGRSRQTRRCSPPSIWRQAYERAARSIRFQDDPAHGRRYGAVGRFHARPHRACRRRGIGVALAGALWRGRREAGHEEIAQRLEGYWVEVPDEPEPSRPSSLRPGLMTYLRTQGGFRSAPSSRAFPGWTVEEIYRGAERSYVLRGNRRGSESGGHGVQGRIASGQRPEPAEHRRVKRGSGAHVSVSPQRIGDGDRGRIAQHDQVA